MSTILTFKLKADKNFTFLIFQEVNKISSESDRAQAVHMWLSKYKMCFWNFKPLPSLIKSLLWCFFFNNKIWFWYVKSCYKFLNCKTLNLLIYRNMKWTMFTLLLHWILSLQCFFVFRITIRIDFDTLNYVINFWIVNFVFTDEVNNVHTAVWCLF